MASAEESKVPAGLASPLGLDSLSNELQLCVTYSECKGIVGYLPPLPPVYTRLLSPRPCEWVEEQESLPLGPLLEAHSHSCNAHRGFQPPECRSHQGMGYIRSKGASPSTEASFELV